MEKLIYKVTKPYVYEMLVASVIDLMLSIQTSKSVGSTTTKYLLNGTQILAQKTGSTTLSFFYDQQGNRVGMADSSNHFYYYIYNVQGDVIALADASTGKLVVTYIYDAWGKLVELKDTTANSVGTLNPFRYRGYYYDTETSLYYLQSRYHDPDTGRFVSADGQLNGGVLGYNMFAYCENNPVNRADSTGEAWYHWALGAAIVVGCAVATVATCGGFAAAAMAVGMVSSGVAASTTAATVAAAAFIGSSTAYGVAALTASSNSRSVKEFCDQGNWGTVAVTALGGLAGGYDGYTMSKAQTPTSTPTNTSLDPTRRTEPANLREKLAMEQVKSNPSAGTPLTKITLNDPRWPSSEGWVKMQQIVPTSQENINIHYVYNQTLKIFDDFKFKS